MTRESIILTILTFILISKNSNATSYRNVLESAHGKTIYKCCPFGEYVGKSKKCIGYNETLTFSEMEVYNENMEKTGKSVGAVFSLLPGRFEDEQFKNETLESSLIEMLNFNLYIVEVSTFNMIYFCS